MCIYGITRIESKYKSININTCIFLIAISNFVFYYRMNEAREKIREITLNNDKLGFIVLRSLRNTCSTSFRALQVSLIQVSLLFFSLQVSCFPVTENRRPCPDLRHSNFFFLSIRKKKQ